MPFARLPTKLLEKTAVWGALMLPRLVRLLGNRSGPALKQQSFPRHPTLSHKADNVRCWRRAWLAPWLLAFVQSQPSAAGREMRAIATRPEANTSACWQLRYASSVAVARSMHVRTGVPASGAGPHRRAGRCKPCETQPPGATRQHHDLGAAQPRVGRVRARSELGASVARSTAVQAVLGPSTASGAHGIRKSPQTLDSNERMCILTRPLSR